MATNKNTPEATVAVEEITDEQLDAMAAQIAELEAKKAEALAAKAARERAAEMEGVDQKLVAARGMLKTGDDAATLTAINEAREAQIEAMRKLGHKVPARARSGGNSTSTSTRGTKVSADGYDRRILTVLVENAGTPFRNSELVDALGQDGGPSPSTGGAVPNAAKSLTTKSLDDGKGSPLPGKVRATEISGTVAYVYEVQATPSVLDGTMGE